jgi:hypothetical protein
VQLRGARLAALQPLRADHAVGDPAAVSVTLPSVRWPVPARGQAAFEAQVLLPARFPAGDYRATLVFDQESAVRFYPPHGEIAFRVPSFWERYGTAVLAGAGLLLGAAVALVLYRRRPIPVALVVEGDGDGPGRPVPFRVWATTSVGGGAADRFRIPGLPQKVAVLERRSVDRFALLSSKPELVPTIPEYTLGDPVEIRLGAAPCERKSVRFVRVDGRSARPRTLASPTG